MSRRKRKREAERRRQQEARRRSKLAAIEREMEAFAAELRAIQDGQLSKDTGELAEDERERWRRLHPRKRFTGVLSWMGWTLSYRVVAWSEEERDAITRASRMWRWLPCVRLTWRDW